MTMNGVSAGAVGGARTVYEIHNPGSNNQENQDGHKLNAASTAAHGNRPATASNNQRSPLGSLPAGRAENNNNGSTQLPTQAETAASTKTKSRNNTLDVDTRQKAHPRNGNNGNVSHADSEDIPENMYRPEKYEAEGWIHREKLAKIENEELQAAGINLAKARTKSDRLRTSSRDRLRTEFTSTDGNAREEKRRKVSSPTPMRAEDEDDDGTHDRQHWDLRSPDEIAAEQTNSTSYTTPVLRRSGSKIPILSPNAGSASPESVEQGPSGQKKRTLSGTVSSGDGMSSPDMRTTSPNWNDDVEGPAPVSVRKTSSPTKTRQRSGSNNPVPSSAPKLTTARKPSISKTAVAPPNGRPRTRGDDSERPRHNATHPEGDPPWLMDMYKPDPRLPPDQQIIPTIAKKQRQMQWEESGMVPKTYDREFTAMAVHEPREPAASRPVEPEMRTERPEDSESWPLKPLPDIQDSKDAVNKGNVTSNPPATGGYSTMPKVTSPPMSIASPKIGSSGNFGATSPVKAGPVRQTTSGSQQQPSQVTQQRPTSDAEDEKIQKKGCGCCVVM